MPITGTDVMSGARAKLNDVAASQFADAVLLPHLKSSYEDLLQELVLNGVNIMESITSPVTIPAGTTFYQLTEEHEVFFVEEKGLSDTLYTPMYGVDVLPAISQGPFLVYYCWRGLPPNLDEASYRLHFLGATENRQIRVYSMITPMAGLVAGSSLLHNSKPYLECRTAYYAALYIQQNESRAQKLDREAAVAKDKVIRLWLRGQQSIVTRQQGYSTPVTANSLLPWSS